MEISVIANYQQVKESQCVDKTVVVIDVFRATSFMVTAFARGCKSILPVASVLEAQEQQRPNDILAGEYHAQKIPHFHLDNSPSTLLKDDLANKRVILCTTNGTRAIRRAKLAKRIIIGSLLNAHAVARFLSQMQEDAIILCAGTRGRHSFEDEVAAGYILQQMYEQKGGGQVFLAHKHWLNQYQRVAQSDWNSLKQSESGQRLSHSKRDRDLDWCIQRDRYDILPQTLIQDHEAMHREFLVI